MKIYIASKIKYAGTWLNFKKFGINIISSWIHEAGENETLDLRELWIRIQREVKECEKLVLYARPQDFSTPLKGAFIEAGMALALNKSVILCLPGVVVDSKTCRPIGSWIHHPLVTREDDIQKALS